MGIITPIPTSHFPRPAKPWLPLSMMACGTRSFISFLVFCRAALLLRCSSTTASAEFTVLHSPSNDDFADSITISGSRARFTASPWGGECDRDGGLPGGVVSQLPTGCRIQGDVANREHVDAGKGVRANNCGTEKHAAHMVRKVF